MFIKSCMSSFPFFLQPHHPNSGQVLGSKPTELLHSPKRWMWSLFLHLLLQQQFVMLNPDRSCYFSSNKTLISLSTLHFPEGEPVRPIDPAAWVSHTAAMTGTLLPPYSKNTIIHLYSTKLSSIHSPIHYHNPNSIQHHHPFIVHHQVP